MRIINKNEQLDGKEVNWSKINYCIFGLGNTQYEHYNKTALDIDKLMQNNGAVRIYKVGLGDNNSSM